MRGGLGCGNITPPPLRMLDVPSAYLPQNDGGYPDHYGAHGFVAPSGRALSLEERCFGLGKQDAIDSAGDQQSAVTNMSNITSASGEASGSSGERDAIVNGAGGGVAGVSHLPISSIASSGGLNSNGLTVVVKKKRNLPGNPDPDAEVVALSPKTLMATNRFVCEICNKGFQRDQNLQLHRRGHNLPWKLKQRSSKEVRKRVYICPEVSCVHHDPARALGDLTGIKKHFCRKHGEKKWKCDKCSKRYAVQSDWKAHSKTCGTREYRCDCGVLFSRRDSFITHRAFCDALTEESARVGAAAGSGGMAGMIMGGHGVHVHSPPSSRSTLSRLASGAPDGFIDHSGNGNVLAGANMLDSTGFISPTTGRPRLSLWLGSGPNDQLAGSQDHFALDPFGTAGTSSFFAENFEAAKPSYASHTASHVSDMAGISSIAGPGGGLANHPNLNLSGCMSGSANPTSGLAGLPSVSTLFSQANVASTAQTSATALLQKAARMGATASDPHLFRGFSSPLYPPPVRHASPTPRPLASHLDFLPPLPLQSSYSGFFQQKPPGIDDLRSSMASRISAADVFQMNCSNSFTNNAGANRLQELTPSLPAPPTNSAPLRMEYILQPKPATGAPFSINSFGSENRDPNPLLPPPTLTKDDSGSMALPANPHSQGKIAMMGFGGNITPKSEDGITRDFLGVRCLDTVFGNQEHTAAPVPGFTQSYSQKDISSTMHRFGMDRYSSSPRDGMI